MDKNDYIRFVDNLYLLNNKSGKLRTERHNIFNSQLPLLKQVKLVEILKWNLLPNHYHILVYELVEGGVSEFTRRLGNAYTKYFNTKNKGRSGFLFQNKAKIIPVTNEKHFQYLPVYIDLNSLDLLFPDREDNQKFNQKKAFDFVKSYEWSSLKDYYNENLRAKIINKELFYDLFDTNLMDYEKEIADFLSPDSFTRQHSMLTGED